MFGSFPRPVTEFVRAVFAKANDKVTTALSVHPSMHEETLDHMLVAELSSTPTTFFAEVGAAVAIETHWLGGRRMYGRWEIADIAILILLRQNGGLQSRKVALLQTKRLYSKEISVTELDETDYQIGIGRLGDRTDLLKPLTQTRKYTFTDQCVFGAMSMGSQQVERIEAYEAEREIPVHYAFYCPLKVPFETTYPRVADGSQTMANILGCRVQSAESVHEALAKIPAGKAPTLSELAMSSAGKGLQGASQYGWVLQDFVADEVLKCREGKLFDGSDDANLQRLFYDRSAPIAAAIAITIDVS